MPYVANQSPGLNWWCRSAIGEQCDKCCQLCINFEGWKILHLLTEKRYFIREKSYMILLHMGISIARPFAVCLTVILQKSPRRRQHRLCASRQHSPELQESVDGSLRVGALVPSCRRLGRIRCSRSTVKGCRLLVSSVHIYCWPVQS